MPHKMPRRSVRKQSGFLTDTVTLSTISCVAGNVPTNKVYSIAQLIAETSNSDRGVLITSVSVIFNNGSTTPTTGAATEVRAYFSGDTSKPTPSPWRGLNQTQPTKVTLRNTHPGFQQVISIGSANSLLTITLAAHQASTYQVVIRVTFRLTPDIVATNVA